MYLGLPSEQQFRGRGVSGCATCDGFSIKISVLHNQWWKYCSGRNLYLSNIAAHVTLVHRRDSLRSEKYCKINSLKKEKQGKSSYFVE
ncbi:MAG: hypothetical protein R3E08_03920 [Thiotrichaceae bacterium]